MHGGMVGQRDENGTVTEPGWPACGHPVTTESAPERTWAVLSQ